MAETLRIAKLSAGTLQEGKHIPSAESNQGNNAFEV
jgi:hypothetical protein